MSFDPALHSHRVKTHSQSNALEERQQDDGNEGVLNHSPEDDVVIEVRGVGKRYSIFSQPQDRLKEFVLPKLHRWFSGVGRASYAKTFWSLKDVDLRLKRGEVLGLIGVNGAGKSSLLQLICGVLQASTGRVMVKGRVAALLELGAGFNPEFTGRENIVLNATLLGLSPQDIKAKTPEIIAFSGIEAFIDQPVKTYSSGMYVRLAFAIATSVEPDILVIDEALSVGDGAFARKSFDKIMDLKAKGVTILFCSHSIYQVEALCQSAIWLHEGQVRASGPAGEVCRHYNDFLDGLNASLGSLASPSAEDRFESGLFLSSNASVSTLQPSNLQTPEASKFAKLKDIQVWVDGHEGPPWVLKSQVSDLEIQVDFVCPLELPTPSVAILINDRHGKHITSCCNHYDQVQLFRNAQGQASLKVSFPRVHLLRGHFVLSVYLLCENALMIYDHAQVCELEVIQTGLELGVVALEREWSQP